MWFRDHVDLSSLSSNPFLKELYGTVQRKMSIIPQYYLTLQIVCCVQQFLIISLYSYLQEEKCCEEYRRIKNLAKRGHWNRWT